MGLSMNRRTTAAILNETGGRKGVYGSKVSPIKPPAGLARPPHFGLMSSRIWAAGTHSFTTICRSSCLL
jgi:hypothetical protein